MRKEHVPSLPGAVESYCLLQPCQYYLNQLLAEGDDSQCEEEWNISIIGRSYAQSERLAREDGRGCRAPQERFSLSGCGEEPESASRGDKASSPPSQEEEEEPLYFFLFIIVF